jgi:hypothetical protein
VKSSGPNSRTIRKTASSAKLLRLSKKKIQVRVKVRSEISINYAVRNKLKIEIGVKNLDHTLIRISFPMKFR